MVKKQLTLATSDFERYRKPTRREKFLAEMHKVVPWQELCALIEPFYPKVTSAGGRPPAGLERMLRIHCLQLWFDLSDPAVEEARRRQILAARQARGRAATILTGGEGDVSPVPAIRKALLGE